MRPLHPEDLFRQLVDFGMSVKAFSLCHVGLKPNVNFTPILISRMSASTPATQAQAISRPVPTQVSGHNAILPGDQLVCRTVARITMGRRSAPDGSRSYQKSCASRRVPNIKLLLGQLHVEVTWFATG